MSRQELAPRARAVADACGDYLARHRHDGEGAALPPLPCPQCWQGTPCGGWLRPVIGKPWLSKCDKCGKVVYRRAGAGRGKERPR